MTTPQNCGTGYCSCIDCIMDDEDDEDATCKVCHGPMYTRPEWGFSQCDDCGNVIQKEVQEP